MNRLATAAVALFVCACGGDVAGRQVAFDGGTLTYHAEPSKDFGGTDNFQWDISSDEAYVRYDGTNLAHGRVVVTFTDVGDTVMDTATIEAGSVPTPRSAGQGKGGPWTVRVDYDNADGVVAFSAVPSH